jgi:hypothetical protein
MGISGGSGERARICGSKRKEACITGGVHVDTRCLDEAEDRVSYPPGERQPFPKIIAFSVHAYVSRVYEEC